MNTLSFHEFKNTVRMYSPVLRKPQSRRSQKTPATELPKKVKVQLGRILTLFSQSVDGRDQYLVKAAGLADVQLVSADNRSKHFSAGNGREDLCWAFYYWLHVNHPYLPQLTKVDFLLLENKAFADVAERPVVIAENTVTTGNYEEAQTPRAYSKANLKLTSPSAIADRQQTDVSAAPQITSFLQQSEQAEGDLHYSKHIIPVLGREREQGVLRDFLNDINGSKFRWLQLAGASGQGKSRLAFELVAEARDKLGWDAGFLTEAGLFEFKDHWSTWLPTRPTLIVIDYILGRESLVSPVIQTLVWRSGDFRASVRLLFIERQRWDRGGIERLRMDIRLEKPHSRFLPSAQGEANWFLKLDPRAGSLSNHALLGTSFGSVLELQNLGPSDLVSLVHEVTKQRGSISAVSDDKIEAVLARIDDSGRPLFAYLLAHQLLESSFDEGWTREDLLTFAIKREQKKRWQAVYQADGRSCPSLDDDNLPMQIARIATMIEGFDNALAVLTLSGENWPRPDFKALLDASILVDAPQGSGAPFSGYIPPLKPDLLGEWFVLWAFTSGVIDGGLLAKTAWRLKPDKMSAFIQRCTEDFPHRFETHQLLDSSPPDQDARDWYAAASTKILVELFESNTEIYPSELLKQIEHAATKQNFEAMALLGYCKLYGKAFEKDMPEAIRLLQKAAYEGKDSIAMSNLANCYMRGVGVPRNDKFAIELYYSAAKAGNCHAMFIMGRTIYQGHHPLIAPDYERAAEWYQQAADLGHLGAMFELGGYYKAKSNSNRNLEKAAKFYRHAAEGGHLRAIIELAECYQNGIGVKSDPEQTVKWYRAAAKREDKYAKDLLTAHPDNLGLQKDDPLLRQWLLSFDVIDWPMAPLISGNWVELTGDNALLPLRALTRFSHLQIGDGTLVKRIRASALPFYHSLLLNEVLLDTADGSKIVCLITGPDKPLLLNGSYHAVRYLEQTYRPTITTSASAADYLRFFCIADQHFPNIIDTPQEPIFHQLERKPKDFSHQISPLRLNEQLAEEFVFSATGQHGDALYRTQFRVRYGHDEYYGPIVLEEHRVLISAFLSLVETGFEGVFRFHRAASFC